MTWNPLAKKSAEAKSDNDAQEHSSTLTEKEKNSRQKNAPTPKRNKAQAKNLRPIVPTDRNASAKEARKRMRDKENAEYEAMRSGDLVHMPKYEQLPWRVYIRDYVDARLNLGEYFIPVSLVLMIVVMALSQFNLRALSFVLIVILYAFLLVVVIDLFIMWRKLRKELIRKFGPESVSRSSRSSTYAWSRAIQFRRWRLPKPRYKKHGNWPK